MEKGYAHAHVRCCIFLTLFPSPRVFLQVTTFLCYADLPLIGFQTSWPQGASDTQTSLPSGSWLTPVVHFPSFACEFTGGVGTCWALEGIEDHAFHSVVVVVFGAVAAVAAVDAVVAAVVVVPATGAFAAGDAGAVAVCCCC